MSTVRPCPSCGQVLDLSGFAPGDQVACPRCGLSMAIAAASATVSVAGAPADSDAGDKLPGVITPRPAKSRTSATIGGPTRRNSRSDRRSGPVTAIAALSAALVVVLVILGVASEWDDEPESTSTLAVPAPAVAEHPPSQPAQRPSRRSEVDVAKVDDVAVSSAKPAVDSSATTSNESSSNESSSPRNVEATPGDMPASAAPTSGSPDATPSQTPASPKPDGAAPTGTGGASPPMTTIDAKPTISSGAPASGAPGEYSTTPSGTATKSNAGGPVAKAEKPPEKQLSPAEQKRLGYLTQLRKLVNRHFVAERRSPDLARGKPEDFFVVAKYEMPLSTRVADVRFEITDTLDKSVDQVVDFLMTSPNGSARDFQVVARYSSMSEAADGIVQVRQQYDQVKEYQAQLLEYLRTQQRIQATATRRC